MTHTEIILLMLVLASATLVALWHNVTVINRMGPKTHNGVRWAYVLKAAGNFGLILAVFDYMHGDPMAWPWLLLGSVTAMNTGTALLHIATRRICQCPECPMRRQFISCGRSSDEQ